jgi:hypothetical protein
VQIPQKTGIVSDAWRASRAKKHHNRRVFCLLRCAIVTTGDFLGQSHLALMGGL